jgi:alanine racemase
MQIKWLRAARMTVSPRLRLTINLDALAANWRWLRNLASPATCAAAVKANAYGLGLAPVARRLSAEGCNTFFVATASEGARLREILAQAVIYVLDGVTSPADMDILVLNGLIPVLNSPAQIDIWQKSNGPCGVMVDTGINRLGLSLTEAMAVNLAHLNVVLWLSHLASADEANHPQNVRQLLLFNQSLPVDFPTPASLANSAGILLGKSWHFDMVRPGIALYGAHAGPTGSDGVQPVVTAEARVIQVRDIPAGETVGYNATWTAARPTRIATLGIGYADGYMRGFSNRGTVVVSGRLCPVIGRVSMDLTIIDISMAPQTQPGDYAEVMGPHIPLVDAAVASGSSQYELLTSLGSRYERRYTGEVA